MRNVIHSRSTREDITDGFRTFEYLDLAGFVTIGKHPKPAARCAAQLADC